MYANRDFFQNRLPSKKFTFEIFITIVMHFGKPNGVSPGKMIHFQVYDNAVKKMLGYLPYVITIGSMCIML